MLEKRPSPLTPTLGCGANLFYPLSDGLSVYIRATPLTLRRCCGGYREKAARRNRRALRRTQYVEGGHEANDRSIGGNPRGAAALLGRSGKVIKEGNPIERVSLFARLWLLSPRCESNSSRRTKRSTVHFTPVPSKAGIISSVADSGDW